MRRKDREVTDEKKIMEIISQCYCCRLGFIDKGAVYIVPLNFGFEKKATDYVFYFHSAMEGRKIECMKTGNPVGFELDTNYQLQEAKNPCAYSAAFQSIIGTGKIVILTDAKEKSYALSQIMYHNNCKIDWQFSPKMLAKLAVFKLLVTELSCKEHKAISMHNDNLNEDKRILLDHIDEIHTTEKGSKRIKTNLKLDVSNVVAYCKDKLLDKNCQIYRIGKNWYGEIDGIKITINAYRYTIITAHAIK